MIEKIKKEQKEKETLKEKGRAKLQH